MKEFELAGCIVSRENITEEEFHDKFMQFIESQGWYFGGSVYDLNKTMALNNVVAENVYEEVDLLIDEYRGNRDIIGALERVKLWLMEETVLNDYSKVFDKKEKQHES